MVGRAPEAPAKQCLKIKMRKVIYVLSHGDRWKVKCEHCDSDIKDTQLQAIKLAKSHVASLPAGTLAQIIIQRDNANFREEWTYGRDPFPPRG